MQKFKRAMAAAIATTMVVGSSMTVLATETTPVTTGGTNATGSNEGHLDTHVIDVTLPTVPEGTFPFNYTMDTERLIQDTNGEMYGSATFPEKDTDTGVYFLTGTSEATTTYTKKTQKPDDYTGADFDTLPASPDQDEYDALTADQQACYDVVTKPAGNIYQNESTKLKAESKSSADVKLKVDVKVKNDTASTDVKLVDAAPASDVTEAQLYLGLKVGDNNTQPIKKDTGASAEVTLAGVPGNFEKTVDNGNYAYKPKQDATGWKSADISLVGAASKASAKGLSAPALEVTWKYEDPDAAPTDVAPSIATTSYNMTADTDVEISVDLGTGDLQATGVSSIMWGSVDLVSKSYATYADGKVTIKANCVNILRNKPESSQTITITFDDDAATEKTVTLNK